MTGPQLTPPLNIPPDPRPSEYQRLAREIEVSRRHGMEPLRIAMLTSSTVNLLRPVMIVEGARLGFALDFFAGDFGQLEQPVLDSNSLLYSAPRDVLVLAFQPADLVPDVFDRYYASTGRDLDTLCAELTDRLVAAARAFRNNTGRPILVANFALPAALPLGPFDAGDPNGLTHRLAAHNEALTRRLHGETDVYVWDFAGLVRAAGSAAWTDARLQLLARVTVASERQPILARHLIRTISALRRPPAKCLVLDLDNTLWGGVVGDDGVEGLHLSDDWPGSPYKAFQRAVLGLRDRGILLAVASKNDEAVAATAFRTHPDMLIKWEDLAAVRINWDLKSTNMRAIAEELNIGPDALVLFDDNPVERAEVCAGLPEARVIDVPVDPTRYREALFASGHFDQLGLSAEDRERADMYRVERQRSILKQEAPSLADFLESLEMEAEIGTAGRQTLGRIAQLIAKTNQFNLTTRRHTPADLARMAASDDTVVAWLRLRDRFGDQGLIGVGILTRQESDACLDTFLMSCRVMNRGVERALMAYLIEHAAAKGCRRVLGEYLPTPKNHMVAGLLPELGFAPNGRSGNGSSWMLELGAGVHIWPEHIRRIDSVAEYPIESVP
jgi:FkbH-like protein